MKTQTGKKIILSDQQQQAALTIFGQSLGQQIISDAAKQELARLVKAVKSLESSVDKLLDIKARILAFEQRNGYSIQQQYFTSLNGQTRGASMATDYFGGAR